MLKESKAEQSYRMNIINRNMKKTVPLVSILLILMIGLLVIMGVTGDKVNEYGLGNPYECRECSKLGFACGEHRGISVQDVLKKKIDDFSMGYTPGMENVEYLIYGEGNTYNKKCDFCNEGKSGNECYACKYDRIAIQTIAEQLYDEGILLSRICSEDWKLGYANCYTDRVILSNMIYDKILGRK